jgi:hypothetical protein
MLIQALILLWAVNIAPPLLAYYLDKRWNRPLDGGRHFIDGKRLLGDHKTWRGLGASLLAGGLTALLLGQGLGLGLTVSALAMAGDLSSSFIKRRLGKGSGQDVPGLDQFFEGIFPLLFLAAVWEMGGGTFFACLLIFCVSAWFLSIQYKKHVLAEHPFQALRPAADRVRMKDLASCRVKHGFFGRFLNFETSTFATAITIAVKLSGQYERGVANALMFEVQKVDLPCPKLPPELEGFSILFLSDLHLDGVPGLTERLIGVLDGMEADICIFGGDYRMAHWGPWAEALVRMRRVARALHVRQGAYAVLGNHDCLEMVEDLHDMGIKTLVNDHALISVNASMLHIVGVDDPHYYRTHNLDEAFQGVPRDAFTVFAAHSPRLYKEAADYGADLYLAGHTHAGQIQVPGLGPIFTHTPAPKRVCAGLWQHGHMMGYTSSGVGASGAPVRFHCRGEVALLRLTRSA